MIKTILTIAVLGSVGSFADPAMAQDKQGAALGSDISSQCAHRRTMPPDPHDDCFRKLGSDAQIGSGQGDASASTTSQNQASRAGPGNGAGIGPGNGNGIGPGSGGGRGNGRR